MYFSIKLIYVWHRCLRKNYLTEKHVRKLFIKIITECLSYTLMPKWYDIVLNFFTNYLSYDLPSHSMCWIKYNYLRLKIFAIYAIYYSLLIESLIYFDSIPKKSIQFIYIHWCSFIFLFLLLFEFFDHL